MVWYIEQFLSHERSSLHPYAQSVHDFVLEKGTTRTVDQNKAQD